MRFVRHNLTSGPCNFVHGSMDAASRSSLLSCAKVCRWSRGRRSPAFRTGIRSRWPAASCRRRRRLSFRSTRRIRRSVTAAPRRRAGGSGRDHHAGSSGDLRSSSIRASDRSPRCAPREGGGRSAWPPKVIIARSSPHAERNDRTRTPCGRAPIRTSAPTAADAGVSALRARAGPSAARTRQTGVSPGSPRRRRDRRKANRHWRDSYIIASGRPLTPVQLTTVAMTTASPATAAPSMPLSLSTTLPLAGFDARTAISGRTPPPPSCFVLERALSERDGRGPR